MNKQYRTSLRRNTRTQIRTQQATSDAWTWLKNLGLAIALLSAAGGLFGYGVAAGLGSQFGLGTGVFYTSTLELLSLCGEGFLGLLYLLKNRFDSMSFLALMMFYAGSTGITVFVALLVFKLSTKYKSDIKVFADRFHKRIQKRKSETGQEGPSYLELIFASVVAAIFGFFSLPAIALCFFVMLLFVAVLPVVGVTAGMSYAKSVVITPESCVSAPQARLRFEEAQRLSKDPRKIKIGAQCVTVLDAATKKMVSGRLIVSRPTYSILYRPSSDDTVLVPIREGSFRSIDAIPLVEEGSR